MDRGLVRGLRMHDKFILNKLKFIDKKLKAVNEGLGDKIAQYVKSNRGELKGERGEKGKDGVNGLDGTNGLSAVPGRNGDDGKDGVDGLRGLKGLRGLRGEKGEDGVTEVIHIEESLEPKEIKDRLETLKGEARLDAKAIKNLPKQGTPYMGSGISRTAADSLYVNVTGDTMTGALFGTSLAMGNRTVTDTTITITLNDYTIRCDCSSNAITVNLPPAADAYNGVAGLIYNIKLIEETNAFTLQADGLELIDGANSIVVNILYDNIQVQSNGVGWDRL